MIALALVLLIGQARTQFSDVPHAEFVMERIELEHGEFVLVRDDKLFLESTGKVIELDYRILAAKRGPIPGTILLKGRMGIMFVIDGSTGEVVLKEEGRDAWVQEGVLQVLSKDRRMSRTGVQYVQFIDEVLELCIDDRGEIVVALKGFSDEVTTIVFKNLRSDQSWITLFDTSHYSDWFSRIGSKIVLDDKGVRWVLLCSNRAGRCLGSLFRIRGSEGSSWVPRALKADGASLFCRDIWRNGKVVGGVFYRFNRDESREWFICPDFDRGTCYKIDEGIREVWPNGDSWVYLRPSAGGRTVIRHGSLGDFSRRVDLIGAIDGGGHD